MKKVPNENYAPDTSSEVWEKGERARLILRVLPTFIVVALPLLTRWPVKYVLFDTAWGKSLSWGLTTKSLVAELVVVGLMFLTIVWAYRRLSRRQSAMERLKYSGKVCMQCGYPRAESTECPECGTHYPP